MKIILPGGRGSPEPDQNKRGPLRPDELHVDENGALRLPEETLFRLGITPETGLSIVETGGGLLIRKADPALSTLYIEPSNSCNLNCRTCIRHSWSEPEGMMSMETYRKLMEGLREVPSLQKVSFWGFGEPLLHPHIVEMVSMAGRLGARTQIVTNALLLDRDKAEGLIEAGLDSIVISADGASTRANARIRSGSDLETVKKNVNRLRDIRRTATDDKPEIGLEFVVMRRNMEELHNLRQLAMSLGAGFIIVTNLLPYTEEMKDEVLYRHSIGSLYFTVRSRWNPEVLLPPLDYSPEIAGSLAGLLGSSGSISMPRFQAGESRGYCRFVGEGSVAVAWDGEVSPCIALMHSYSCFIMGRRKEIKRYAIGNVAEIKIGDLFSRQDFAGFRERVKSFDFSPCTQCSGCDLSESNEEDCFGNTFPVCGDCLWAQGIIQCP